VVGTLGSDGWVGYFPNDFVADVNFLMWNHPYESPYDDDIAGTGDSGWTFTLTSWLLDNGIAIASSNDAGDQFGNAAVMAAEDALFGQVDDFFAVDKLVVYGESMGGAACLNWTARNNTAPLVGAMVVSGVCDTSKFSSYFPYDADYNPMITAASDWAGLPIFLASSPSDTTVLETENADPFVTHVSGQATTTHIETTGGHLTSGNYPVSNMESWWTAVFFGDAVVNAVIASATVSAPAPSVTTSANATVDAVVAEALLNAPAPTVTTVVAGDVTVNAPVASVSAALHTPNVSTVSPPPPSDGKPTVMLDGEERAGTWSIVLNGKAVPVATFTVMVDGVETPLA
jgi:hypothetical protein